MLHSMLNTYILDIVSNMACILNWGHSESIYQQCWINLLIYTIWALLEENAAKTCSKCYKTYRKAGGFSCFLNLQKSSTKPAHPRLQHKTMVHQDKRAVQSQHLKSQSGLRPQCWSTNLSHELGESNSVFLMPTWTPKPLVSIRPMTRGLKSSSP